MEIEKIKLPGIDLSNIYVLRLDKSDPIIGGNKSFKLKFNLEKAQQLNSKGIISFGGSASNHIAALAKVANDKGFQSIGIIRGEKSELETPTLKFAISLGMQLEFIPREEYRLKEKSELVKKIIEKNPGFYLLPEGGANEEGALGCINIMDFIPEEFVSIFASCGTGTTLAGLVAGRKIEQKIFGVSALKGGNFLYTEIDKLLLGLKNNHGVNYFNPQFEIITEYHFGGFAKLSEELINFKNEFESLNNFTLDYLYTSKMFFAIRDLIMKNKISNEDKIIAVHSGGIQGNEAMEKRYRIQK